MITPEGDFLSNLTAPDLRPHFKHLHWRAMPHSMGHLVASDWKDKADDDPVFGLYKNCGLWTRDEAAILYHCGAACFNGRGTALDIGSHTGWTSAHLLELGFSVVAVDPMYANHEFVMRLIENTRGKPVVPTHRTSLEYFADIGLDFKFDLVCVDGDHEPGKPVEDARNAEKHLREDGAIILHDGLGKPVRDAVAWLLDRGFRARAYWTPHLIFFCWRGGIIPPRHEPDSRIDWLPHVEAISRDFDLGRLE